MSDETYDGPVVFVDGVHYPATVEETALGADGEKETRLHADLDRPLRWFEGTTYRDAEEGEPLHNDLHHVNRLELRFDVEGGEGGSMEVTPDEFDRLKQHLADIRKEGE